MMLDALILSLPARNSTVRMRVWRALKDLGCATLRDGVYVLPAGSPRSTGFAAIEAQVRAAGGSAMTIRLETTSEAQQVGIAKLFDRTGDYAALDRRIGAVKKALPQLGARKAATAVQRMQRAFDKVAAADFFPGHAKAQAGEALAQVNAALRELAPAGEPRPARKRPRQVDARRYRKRVWATRADPWVDRLASAWLIKRFIDRDARFVWIREPRQRPRNAVGFDFDGARFSHAGDRVTFEVLLASFGLEENAALAAIGRAVHYLDVGGIPVADASGLATLLQGSKARARDDDALLAEAMRMLDLLYAAYAARDRDT